MAYVTHDHATTREWMKLRLKKGAGFFVARYGLPVLVNAFVAQLTFKIEWLQEVPYVLFFAVAVASTLCGGIGPGLFAVAISAFLVAFCFIPPYFQLSVHGNLENTLQIALYVGVCGMICAFLADWKRKVLHFQDEAARYHSLADSTPDGVVLLDDCERIIYANEAGERLLGSHRGQLVGQLLDVFVPREIYGPKLEELRHRVDSRKEVEPVQFVPEKEMAKPVKLTWRTFTHHGHALFAAWLRPAAANESP